MNSSPQNPLLHALNQQRSNPLLRGLPPRKSMRQLAMDYRHAPITPENVSQIDLQDRHALLDEFKKIIVPTTANLPIIYSLQEMFFAGLVARDPRIASNRILINELGQQKDKDLESVSWQPTFASGMVLDGITGTGKSQLIDRFASMLPQVVEHGPNDSAGWKELKQLVWLKIYMPADGTRGGLLTGAFLELDKTLGTNYSEQYASYRWTIEKKLVVFLHLLAVHRCGLLIIEEAQEKNLGSTAFSREFLTFFLRILNWGVPTVMVGNPLAFSKIRSFSQDADRFSEAGWFHLEPVMNPCSSEWTKDWIPNLWHPSLLDEPDETYTPFSDDPLDATLEGFVWRRTGGIPRLLCRLRREVQSHALRCGAPRVTAAMVDLVYRTSAKMQPAHMRIEAFSTKNWRLLVPFSDIPAHEYRRLWAPLETDSSMQVTNESPTTVVSKGRRVTKADPTGAKNGTKESLSAKAFQDGMFRGIAKAAGVDPDTKV